MSLDYESFVQNNSVSMTAEWIDQRPDAIEMDGDHWKCVIKSGCRRMTVYFTQGYGYAGLSPSLQTVLHCLQGDAHAGNQSFEYFCSDFGYDTDSRRAHKIWKVCKRTYDKLNNLFGIQLDAFLSLEIE